MPPGPSLERLAVILRTCNKEKGLPLTLRIFAYIRSTGMDAHASLGNHMVSSLVELQCMCIAHKIFDRLSHPNETSWSSLVIGYVRGKHPRQAVVIYETFRCNYPCPSVFTFVAVLKACAELENADLGCAIHDEIIENGLLEKNVFLGNALIHMYFKCGALGKAQEAFDVLPKRDVISWTALITGYMDHDFGEEALFCYEQMLREGISPNSVTFVCTLKACGKAGSLEQGEKIHFEIARRGDLADDVAISSALVDMYLKVGAPEKAQEIFDKLQFRNVFAWTALIAGFAKDGSAEKALCFYEHMQLEGVSPNAVTYLCSLKACGIVGDIDKGREIHDELIGKKILKYDVNVGNALVDMYAKCGYLVKAQQVFDELPVRNIITWNSLITGYSDHDHGEEVLSCYKEMHHQGAIPDAVTFVCSLKACGKLEAVDEGREMYAEVARRGFAEENQAIGVALVDMYAKCGSLVKAHEVFDKLQERDMVAWTALISGYSKHEYGEEALRCFEQMQLEGFSCDAVTLLCSLKACGSSGAEEQAGGLHAEIARQGLLDSDLNVGNALIDMYSKLGLLPKAQEVFDKLPYHDVVSWTALIAGYAKHAQGKEALKCYEEMQLERFSPDAATYVCILNACACIGAIEQGKEVHAQLGRNGFLEKDLNVGNALIDMYAKCGLLEKAREVFDNLQVRDVVSWTTLIVGYAKLGESADVFSIFQKMITEGEKPDLVTFTSLMSACSHTGLVESGQVWYEVMSKDYGISPTVQHLFSMVDLLSRAGYLDRAIAMVKDMQPDTNHVLWHSLLTACQKWGNVDIAAKAFEHAMQADEAAEASCAPVWDIYANRVEAF
ncbi:hypothetical protein GOP47_0013064 [Adiantum capillus-veneris]|uniref:Pentatricopeptide repeat-containing protein n=1 Tax=Adiantum capillus-veneris TaxID=13818 RepID=A0A9D4URW6_ADICA|nr:hypothetical protein GOP47_0013064 [Adiantum capillus-veneris]